MAEQSLTMTLREVWHAMRDAGIRTSEVAISAGIASGLYPFGHVTNVGETGRRTIVIFRVDFYQWLESKTPRQQPTVLQLNPQRQAM